VQAQISQSVPIAGRNRPHLLFIAHDLSVDENIRTGWRLMYLGKIVGDRRYKRIELAAPSQHPYTQALIAACRCAHADRGRGAARESGDNPSALTRKEVPLSNELPHVMKICHSWNRAAHDGGWP